VNRLSIYQLIYRLLNIFFSLYYNKKGGVSEKGSFRPSRTCLPGGVAEKVSGHPVHA
jgi:hypothetical protein